MGNTVYNEEWRDIPSFIGYQASDLGRIRVFAEGTHTICHQTTDGRYMSVSINSSSSKHPSRRVHQLVCMAFLSHQPNRFEIVCDHINNIKTDNRLVNLQLVDNRVNSTKDKREGCTSKYVGVSLNGDGSWNAHIRLDKGSQVYLGCYNTDSAARFSYLRARVILSRNMDIHEHHPHLVRRSNFVKASKYVGVAKSSNGKWGASIGFGVRKNVSLGVFDSEGAARVSYLRAVIILRNGGDIEKEHPSRVKLSIRNASQKSQYVGIGFRNGMWNARVSVNGKRIFVGAFKTEHEAFEARNTFIEETIK